MQGCVEDRNVNYELGFFLMKIRRPFSATPPTFPHSLNKSNPLQVEHKGKDHWHVVLYHSS